MEHELLGVLVVGGGGLQAADEGAVAQLRLRVRADQLQVPGAAQPLALLLGGRLGKGREREGGRVKKIPKKMLTVLFFRRCVSSFVILCH